ncbi:MAG: ISKra4-like element ISTvi1 family transposase, partial [Terriglobia bacterium]
MCLAHEPGSVTPVFGATTGGVNEAGDQWWECAMDAGGGSQTKLHGLGDGASWITDQMERKFGTQGQYLVDFCHLCEYLTAAAPVVAGQDKGVWMEEKKNWLKQ